MHVHCIILALGLATCSYNPAWGQFVTLEGRKFMLNGTEFYPRVMNFAMELASNTGNSSTGIYFSMNHVYGAPPDGNLRCVDAASCRTDLLQAFQKVASMGFNTLRLVVGVGPELRGANGGEFYFNVRHNMPQGGDPWPPYIMPLEESTNFHGPVSDEHFDRLRELLETADEAGLKVILLSIGSPKNSGWSAAWDWSAVHRVTPYFARLAEELREQPALLAYDLQNEPHWTDQGFRQWNKSDVCAITSEWYDALHTNDPNHLVTLGSSAFEDVYAWEPNVMKLDFVSIHLYPDLYSVDAYNFDSMLDRIKARIYWYSKACPMPYIIGETAFSAEVETDDHWGPGHHLDDVAAHHLPPWMNGTEQQQATYAQSTMDATRDYWGSGYSWWEFQNSNAGSLDDPPPPEAPNGPPAGYLGKFYGPLKFGDAAAVGGPVQWYDKEVVSTFEDYDLPPAPVSDPSPPNQYEWGRFNGSHGSGTLLRTIALWDQNNEPIRQAVGWQKMHYHSQSSGLPTFEIENWSVSYWDGNLIIRDGPTYPNTGEWVNRRELEVHVPGGISHKYFSMYDPPSSLSYHREDLNFKKYAWDFTVPVGETRNLRAWSWLVALEVVYAGNGTTGATGTLRARDLVELRDGFHAQLGSDVHVYNEAVWPDCSSPELNSMPPVDEEDGATTSSKSTGTRGTLELVFAKPAGVATSVQPNPCTDHVLLNTTEPAGEYVLRNASGAILATGRLTGTLTRLDMEGYTAGSYSITIRSGNVEQSHWITKIN